MKKLFFVLTLLLTAGCAFSQPTGTGTAPSLDIEGERDRIQAERAREEARYQTEEAACYARFSVTDCQREVRVRRRQVLDDLRRQDLILNDAERKRKALAQMERIQERSSAQPMEEGAGRRVQVREAPQEREERAKQKTSAALNAKSGQSTAKSAQRKVEPGHTSDDVAEEQKRYDDKLKAAQEHRVSREKSNSEKSGTFSKPLPASP
ncbi:hypothetical protein [Rhodoferax sp. UBA5149]|uniref:hypothetical protein n=1 Tax=Rhodoferax sp. UBA5149 TaxID=1947379 RepID=UPI0025CE8496|nr:hypothetical protein [Rhodoferax sp. UBA5149]